MKKNIRLLFVVLFWACSARAQYAVVHSFNGNDGEKPYSALISDGAYLYGVTNRGGTYGMGTIFKVSLADGTLTDIYYFNGTDGRYPYGSLIMDGDYLYGMTPSGGAFDNGNIFKINKSGGVLTDMHDFDGAGGANPYGSLVIDGDSLYGMTTFGGTAGDGTVFKINKDGSGFVDMHDFNGSDSGTPYGSLVSDGAYLYGMTYFGGNFYGNIFKISKIDGTLTNMHNFSGTDGANPYGSLIIQDGYLYGMTSGSGLNNNGNIFKLSIADNSFTSIYDFNGIDGATPLSTLFRDGNYLYGTTFNGGLNTYGNIFKVNLDGTGFISMHDFVGTDGAAPSYGSLISVNNSLYGMTGQGGANGKGVLYKFDLSTAMAVHFISFTATFTSNGNRLDWATGEETNSKGFQVEVSTNDKDFTGIDFVAAKGSTSRYRYIDTHGYNVSTVYYRLKQIDIEGKIAYSPVVSIRADENGGITVYPNPASASVTVTDASGDIQIFNNAGKAVLKGISSGAKTIIDIRSLPSGIYFIVDAKGNRKRFMKE